MSDPLKDVIAEMRTMAMVAGQASVETLNPVMAGADARFAEYCSKWADRLAALAFSLEQERDEQQDHTRVDGFPEGAHGDLPRPATR